LTITLDRVATGWGIILSPYVARLFKPRQWAEADFYNEMTLFLTRIVIALSVFAVGVELPRAYMARHWRSLFILVGPKSVNSPWCRLRCVSDFLHSRSMIMGWLISAAFMDALFPKLNFLHCMVIAAALSPTDPVLASSVVGKGKFAQDVSIDFSSDSSSSVK
jgi:NhaP-type Na+/H+ or K+/H+ antiporter